MRGAFLAVILVAIVSNAGASEIAPRTLYLVRHGFYDHEDPGDPDVGKALVPLGVAQARLVAARLQAFPAMTAIRTSTMTRARQTALVIGESFPRLAVEETRLLRECTPPSRRQEVMAGLEPGEPEACVEQLEEAFATLFVPSNEGERHEVLVCHGNVIRYLATRALGVDSEAWLGFGIGNCSVTVIRVNPDGSMKVLSFGDVGHIPPNLQTGWDAVDRGLAVPRE